MRSIKVKASKININDELKEFVFPYRGVGRGVTFVTQLRGSL